MSQFTSKDLDLADSICLSDPHRALAIVDNLLKDDPNNSDAILIKYHSQRKLGNWADALETAGKLANVSSDKSLSYLLQADMFLPSRSL